MVIAYKPMFRSGAPFRDFGSGLGSRASPNPVTNLDAAGAARHADAGWAFAREGRSRNRTRPAGSRSDGLNIAGIPQKNAWARLNGESAATAARAPAAARPAASSRATAFLAGVREKSSLGLCVPIPYGLAGRGHQPRRRYCGQCVIEPQANPVIACRCLRVWIHTLPRVLRITSPQA